MSTADAFVRLAAVASKQFGCFTRGQLLRVGFSASTAKRLVRDGRWVRVHRGVYRERAVPASPEQDAIAAWLACGASSVVSHRTAARLWGAEAGQASPEVLIPVSRRVPDLPGILAHRTRSLPRRDVVGLKGMRVTSGQRTIADLAAVLDDELEETFDALWGLNVISPDRLAPYLSSRWALSAPGTKRLRDIVAVRVGLSAPASKLESRFFALLRRARLPLPVPQFRVWTPTGYRFIDYAYPDVRVAIELEGLESRRSRRKFDDEPLRQNDIEALGWTFRRYTWTHVTQRPVWVVSSVGEAIGLSPVRWR